MLGEPLTRLVKTAGWDVYVMAMVAAAIAPLILLAPFWNVRSYKDLTQSASTG